ncbi:metal-sensing transcriptional repressor [Liquorilactobacillus sicerae]|uniref:metal-sensing transcriptional repressor n=1 Tax=Liquorilactobacillus sicerae TaxID=1416943 RepID=UPI002480488C|nr:metal-sensing transcriptional repressor [Liquorilactobacillus sicerae]
MNNQADCSSVTTQLLAVKSGVDKVLGWIALENLKVEVDEETTDSKIGDGPEIQAALKILLKTR